MKIISYLCRLLVCVLLLLTTNALKATESLVLPVSATASAHTVWGGTWYTGPANLAIDQNNITKWTLEGMGWIDFDLGSTKNIHEVRAYWGGSVSNGNCVNIYIDGTKVISNHKCGAYENVIPLDAPRSGRMIRYETIALPHNEYNQIATWSELAEFTVLVGTVDTDSDSDGLVDSVETNTGVFVSQSNTGTNPNSADSDADGVPDGLEVKEKTSPVDATKFNSFSQGLVAYYPFDGDANDESGNGDHGKTVGGVIAVPDRFLNSNGSFEFDGSGAAVVSKDDNSTLVEGSFTVSVWLRPKDLESLDGESYGGTSYGHRYALAGVHGRNDSGVCLAVGTNGISVLEHGGQFLPVVLSYPKQIGENWVHVAIKCTENGPPILYVNGEYVETGLNTGRKKLFAALTMDDPFGVGSGVHGIGRHWYGGFKGTIDDVRVYNRSLSDEEINALYSTNHSHFQIIEGSYTWHEAKADAEARGGRLAVLDTQEKIDEANAYIHSLGTWPEVWIGLTDEAQEGNWNWITGAAVASAPWSPSEPNGSGNYALIYGSGHAVSGLWDDQPNYFSKAYLIEYTDPDELSDVDTDGDGVNDYREGKDGTNPNNAYSFDPRSKGMVAYYRFNENFNDESGFQNDLSNMTSGVQISGDRFGNMVGSVKLTSNEDYAFSVKKSGISGNQNHSISLWVYFAEAPVWDGRYEGSLVRLGSAVGVVEGSEIGRESRIMVDNYNEPGQSQLLAHGGYSDLEKKGLGDIFLGQWRHIVFSYNGQISTSSLYLDGVKLDASLWMGLNNIRNIVDGPVYLGSTPLVDGRASGSVCQLSDIRIYNRALSAEEVASLYTAESTPKSSFQIIEGSFTWREAKADAEARGGRLAVLDTQEKMDAVRDLFQATEQSNHLHLGMTDEQQEGEWQWIDGSPVALTNWEIGEPNNQGDEDYGMIYFPSATWNDGHASSYWGYLLEMPSDNLNVDTDGDGLVDSVETNTGVWVSLNNTGTDPNKADSDADGLTDGDEVNQHATNPLIADTDGDGYSDGNEVQSGSNPNDPGSVPNAYSGPLFTDITTEVLSLAKHSIVAVMDYDRDGKEDLLVGTDSGTRLLKQTGSFQFDDITAAAGLDGLQNVFVADFTNDGLEDILDIASDKTYAFIRANNGEGYYVKTDLNQVIEGDLSSYRDLMTGDIDNDGDIDLIYAVSPPFGGGAVAYLPNITKRGAQNVQFGQKSYLVRTSWQFAKFDLTDANNDGLTDLVILQTNGSWPYDTHPDHPAVLYLGTGRDQNDYLNPEGSNAYVGFVEKADCGINAANEMSRFTSWDIDNDGDLDLINGSSDWRWVSNPHIYINDGAGNYAQQGSPVYHSGDYYHHGITIFDADADNDLDAVWTGLHNFSNIYPRMWKNKGGLSFNDVTVEWGIITSQIAGSGNLGSNGYAADLDDDGDQDFVVQASNGWGSETYYAVYRNNADQKRSKCLKIELEGTSSHAKGFGARVEVRANGKTLSQWVSNHVGSVPTSRLHFGLGESHDVEFINVYWPSGLKSSLSNPNIVGSTLKITEPASEPAPRFQIIEGSYTWHEAKADAEARGGRLAVLDTQKKIDEAIAFLHSQGTWPVMWTGLDGVINYEEYIDYNEPVFSNEYERYEWLVMLEMQKMQLIDASLCKKVIWGGRYPDSISFGQIDMDFLGYPLRRPGEIWIMIVESPIVYSYLLELPKKVLSLASSTHGAITGSGEYNTGATATLTATPNAGYIFAGWTGDATGTTNPLSLTMDADKVVGANFEPDQSDSDGDGLTNYEELAIYYTNPSLPDTDGDGHSDAGEVQRGSDPCNPASIPAKLNNWIESFTLIPNNIYSDAPFLINFPTASSGLPVVVSIKSGPATISGTTVTLTGVGTVVLAANQAGNANYLAAAEVTTSFTVSKATQTISAFATISPKAFGSAPFAVKAPASTSGLPVTLSVKSGPATISGNTMTMTGVGTVVLAANQAGNANYTAATEVKTSFTVTKAAQTIAGFALIGNKAYADLPFTVTAPVASSGLPVNLKVKSGPATISGNTVALTGVGTVILAANQAGNVNYLTAQEVTTSFAVSKATQTISAFSTITPKTFGAAPFAVTAPTSNRSLPVTLSVKSGPATISGNTVTLTGAGTVILAANQAGNANYLSAPEVTTSFTVSKATQTIGAFATIAPKVFGAAPFAVTAPTSNRSLPVTLSVKSGPATISGNTVTLTGAGTVVLAANQVGNANYLSAPEVTTSFTVSKATQTIGAFATITSKTFGVSPFTVTVRTTNRSLPVTLSVKSGPATISGNTVTLTGAGTVVLAANQVGNANYLSAPEVTTSFTVSKATQRIGAFATITSKTFGASPFTVTVPTSNRSLPVTLSVKSGPATISGNTATITGVGTVILAANQSGDANYLSVTEVTTSFTVSKATQTIGAFTAISPKKLGSAPFAVTSPLASSKLPVVLKVKSGPANISGNTVTVTGVGTVVLAANQAGNDNYMSAREVTTSFKVTK